MVMHGTAVWHRVGLAAVAASILALPVRAQVTADPGAARAGSRLMRPDDLFRVEAIGAVSWSPDGALVAVEISQQNYSLNTDLRPTAIWLVDATTRSLRRLSDQPGARLRFWSPIWSPDGQRLAFLSVDRDGVVRPWVWSRTQSRAREIRDLDLQVNIGGDPPLVWLTKDRFAALAWHPSAKKGQGLQVSVLRSRYASELWARAREGREPSVTVLESGGVAQDEPSAQVMLIDVPSGQRRQIAEGQIHRLMPSPDGRFLAFFRANPGVPAQPVSSFLVHNELYTSVNWGTELHVIDVDRGRNVATPVDLVDPGYDFLRWSPNGDLVLPGTPRGSSKGLGFSVLRDGRFQRLDAPLLDSVMTATWLGDRTLVSAKGRGAGRRDWWVLADHETTNLTASVPAAADVVYPASNETAVAAAAGDLWRLSASSPPMNLTASFAPRISQLRAVDASRGRFFALLDGSPAFLSVSGDTVRAATLTLPHPDARLRALSPRGTAAIYFANTANGSHLWLIKPNETALDSAQLWWGNRWVAAIKRGQPRRITYSALDGTTLQGWILLPPGHTDGKRIPLVVRVYPGRIWGSGSPFVLPSTDYLEPELYAALGHAVLLPSMPAAEGSTGDVPVEKLTNGVLPAIDTLIRLGIVDTNRIAVVGLSGGGYATLGLITQTNRFRAAIAVASYANMISLYGTFYGQFRYGDAGHPQRAQVLRIMQMERGFQGMGGPPWTDLRRYVGSSPLFQVEKVTTPVMLVHGDMDFIPIQQAEEFFTALYRQDKRVRFVRYHGEGHGPASKPSVLHLWGEMESWLKEMFAS